MAYDLNDLKGGYKERNKPLSEGEMSAMDMNDRNLELLNQGFRPLQNLGFELEEDGKVPVRDGVPRIFIMQPGEDGIDRVKTLDEAGIRTGTREFWNQVQKGNVFAYPTGSENPVQIQADIRPGRRPEAKFSAPLDMEDVHAVPENHEYREPNAFTRFMNRIFSGWRRKDCEIYRERQKFAANAEKRRKGMAAEQEELKAAEKVAAAKAEKEKQKAEYDKLEKAVSNKKNGKEFYRDLVAPQPKYHKEHSTEVENGTRFYTKEEFSSLQPIDKKIEDYSIGGKPLSMDEYCGLVVACSHSTKFVDEGFKFDSNYDPTLVPTLMNNGYTEKQAKEIIVNSYSTMISDDLMKGDLRYNQGIQLKPTVNPARHMTFEILDEYKQGKKDKLAEAIADGVKNAASVTDNYKSVPHNGACNHFEFSAAAADLLERDPELKDLAMKKGLKQEDVDAVNCMREYSKMDSKRNIAKAEIAKAVYEGRELSYQDKMQYSKDIINANIMESKLFGENLERERNGKEYGKVSDELLKNAEKDGLTVTAAMKSEWNAHPGTRPLPPKGKYYSDQVITIMSGRSYEFNKHPETLFEFSDPEDMMDCRMITEEIVTSKGLADMSVKDLNKAVNSPGNMLQGVKLVEEVDKAAQKISEQRYREELGLDEPRVDTSLDKSFDLGHKEPKAGPGIGGPIA